MSDFSGLNPTINNWNRSRFLRQSDFGAMRTMDDTLGWYGKHLEDYKSAASGDRSSRQAYQEFKSSVDELDGMYREHLTDGDFLFRLDRNERKELLGQGARADYDLSKLIQNDIDRTAPALRSDARSKTSRAVEPAFNGRYAAVADGALDSVADGDALIGLGDKGPDVADAQELMKAHGAEFTKTDTNGNVVKDYGADGMFGEVSQRELRGLQKEWGLEETGTLDKSTLERLREDPAKARYPVPTEIQAEYDGLKSRVDALNGSPGGRNGRALRSRLERIEGRMTQGSLQKEYERVRTERDTVLDDVLALNGSLGGRRGRTLRRRLDRLDGELSGIAPNTNGNMFRRGTEL